MKDEQSTDAVTQPPEVDHPSVGPSSTDERKADSVAEASSGLEDPPVDPAQPLNPA